MRTQIGECYFYLAGCTNCGNPTRLGKPVAPTNFLHRRIWERWKGVSAEKIAQVKTQTDEGTAPFLIQF